VPSPQVMLVTAPLSQCWQWHDVTAESCWRWHCQDIIGHGVMSLPSHVGDDAIKAMSAMV
jgi:hypothetical protein